MKQAIAVRFEDNGKEQYFDPAGLAPQPGDYVMAATPKGPACGQVTQAARPVPGYLLPDPLPALVRMADSVDIRRMHQPKTGFAKKQPDYYITHYLRKMDFLEKPRPGHASENSKTKDH